MVDTAPSLAIEACQACHSGAPSLSEAELARLKPQLPRWEIVQLNGVSQLQCEYAFKDYAAALAFTNRVAALAEQEQHHPEIKLEWGKVTANWWTHDLQGLHRNAAIMAANTEALL